MAINRSSIRDPAGRRSDWIEIHNPNTVAIPLSGYYLTDDTDRTDRWYFPEVSIGAGEFLIVYAVGNNRPDNFESVTDNSALFADFKLSGDGEYLALVFADGELIEHEFSPAFPPQRADISCGLFQAELPLRYFDRPTPGQPNNAGFDGIVADTKFSEDRGFFENRFGVEISTATPEATIRYTLDGSIPDLTNGFTYQRPIPVTSTTTLRASAFRDGYLPTNIDTQTYVFTKKVIQQSDKPAGFPDHWGSDSEVPGRVVADYEMDPRVVETTLDGYSVQEALLDIPTLSVVMNRDDFLGDQSGIYNHPKNRGGAWEKECSFEWFDPSSGDDFQVDCRIEIHGNSSRRPWRMQKHSLRLSFVSELGAAKLRFPLFPESPVEEFNKLVIRACFTDSWGLVSWGAGRYRPNDSQYIRDVWMKESFRDMGQPSSYGDFAHLYINGLYWGIYNITERLEDDFFSDHFGGREEDWQIVEDLSGGNSQWQSLMASIRRDGDHPDLMQLYRNELDFDNFIDYMLLHFYADAEDWPHHNGYIAGAPEIGIPFRFFVWDQEIVLDNHALQRYDRSEGGKPGELFQILRKNNAFKRRFADRTHAHLSTGGALSLDHSRLRYRALTDRIDKAIVAESARWGDVQSKTPYGNRVEQPSPLTRWDHRNYPPAPHGPDFYFTRQDSWLIERDNVLQNYLPRIYDESYGNSLLNELRREGLYPSVSPPLIKTTDVQGENGLLVTLITDNGSDTFFTLDGSDPRKDSISEANLILVHETSPVRMRVPQSDTLGKRWIETGFNDQNWLPGRFGIGYETGSRDNFEELIQTDVSIMYRANPGIYLRTEFEMRDRSTLQRISSVQLNVQYDDGFVAYLNGKVIASSNAPEDPVWNSRATQSRREENAVLAEPFFVQDVEDLLLSGDNVLAIHALNADVRSDDLLLVPTLEAHLDQGKTGQGGARQYDSPFLLNEPGLLQSASLVDGEWSALATVGIPESLFPERAGFSGNPFEDQDRDGLSALIEYALGTDDTDPNSGWKAVELSTSAREPTNADFEIRINRHSQTEDVSLFLEYSMDLVTWMPMMPNDFISVRSVQEADSEITIWKVSGFNGSGFFLRLKAAVNPNP